MAISKRYVQSLLDRIAALEAENAALKVIADCHAWDIDDWGEGECTDQCKAAWAVVDADEEAHLASEGGGA